MDITVGGRKLIANAILQVPKGEDAWIEFPAGTWNVRLHIKFVDDDAETEQKFTIEPSDDHAVIEFKNWNQSVPGASLTPNVFGETDGRKVSFILSGFSVEGFKFMNFSFFWEN